MRIGTAPCARTIAGAVSAAAVPARMVRRVSVILSPSCAAVCPISMAGQPGRSIRHQAAAVQGAAEGYAAEEPGLGRLLALGLARDFERHARCAAAVVRLAMIRIMLRRQATRSA